MAIVPDNVACIKLTDRDYGFLAVGVLSIIEVAIKGYTSSG